MPLFMFISSTLVTAVQKSINNYVSATVRFDELYSICTVYGVAPNKQHPLEHSCYAQSIAQMERGVQSIAQRV